MDELEWDVKELKDDAMVVDGEVKNSYSTFRIVSGRYTEWIKKAIHSE